MLNTHAQIKKRNEIANNSCLTKELYNGQPNDEDIERTTKLLQDELTSKPDTVDPKERDGFWLELGGRGKEILGFGSGFWALDPAPAATKTVLGHGTEIEAMLSLLRAKPKKEWCPKLLSFEFYWQKDRRSVVGWWSFVEKCGDGIEGSVCECCGKSEKPK